MIEVSYEIIEKLCKKSALSIAGKELGIGREISYINSPIRTVVVRFIDSDYPNIVRKTLQSILSIEEEWFLINRYGLLSAKKYIVSSAAPLAETLIRNWSKVVQKGDDVYLIGASGTVLLSFDHHIIDDGMAIYLSDIQKTGNLLSKLNVLGSEFELFSKHS